MNTIKRIGLIEPFDHSEVLYVLCELLFEQEVELCVFCQQYILEDCPDTLKFFTKIQWNTFSAEDRTSFFNRHLEKLNKCQLLIWITAPPSSYGWINRLRLQIPVVLLIHNLHTWLTPWGHLQLSWTLSVNTLTDVARLMRFIIWQRFQQQQLLHKVAAIGMPSRNMLTLANQLGMAALMRKALFIPFAYCHEYARLFENTEEICIVIPGVVHENGRNYQLVADAFKAALPGMKRRVNLILLGQAREPIIVHALQKLEGDLFQLTFFSGRIPQNVYDAYLKKAHFLILPFAPTQKFGVVREKWGRSKISGSINDMIRYRIPTICSAHYDLDTEQNELIATYLTSEELAVLLVDWVNRKGYLKYGLSEEKYDKHLLSEQLYQQLNALIQMDHDEGSN